VETARQYDSKVLIERLSSQRGRMCDLGNDLDLIAGEPDQICSISWFYQNPIRRVSLKAVLKLNDNRSR